MLWPELKICWAKGKHAVAFSISLTASNNLNLDSLFQVMSNILSLERDRRKFGPVENVFKFTFNENYV